MTGIFSKPATQAGAARPLSLETTGGPEVANSHAPQAARGRGMGGRPMSPDVQPVPLENTTTARATAQGIVTRMGQDRNGLGGAAIEPGPAGMRPACSGFDVECTDACATCGRARWRSAGAGAGAGQAPTIPDGNHGDNQQEATE